ncbi:MAG: ZPR1 zinc finger domain-containing protein [Methanotrichaceae archaeon]
MKVITTANCPLCGAVVKFEWVTKNIPHFGEAMIITGVCECCSFKHTDTILLDQGEPTRYTFTIKNTEDLNTRVIKSTSGTIRLPELGIDMEPGPISEAYISNVEGVLQKIMDVVDFATRSAKDADAEDSIKRGEKILECMKKVLEGQRPLTIVMEDPLGKSSIVSENAVSSKLTKEECEDLNIGMAILESSS